MKKLVLTLVALVTLSGKSNAQLYFPPLVGNTWDTVSPQQLGWCTNRIDSLYDLLQRNNTKAFIILKDGKMKNKFLKICKENLYSGSPNKP